MAKEMALGEARVGGEETVAHFVGGELVSYRNAELWTGKGSKSFFSRPSELIHSATSCRANFAPQFIKVFSAWPTTRRID